MRPRCVLPALILILAGCETAPAPVEAAKPAAAMGGRIEGGRMERELQTASATVSAAAQETARRLQANDPKLSVAVKSRFYNDPAYRESLAGSVILQTTTVQRSSVSNASYRIAAIEIHALPDGRVRVWSEFTNGSNGTRTPQVYCRFNDTNERDRAEWRTLTPLAPGKRQLVYFDSKDANVSRVTVMVR